MICRLPIARYASRVKTWWKRLLIAFVVAWFLPEPNLHASGYIPLIYAAAIDPDIGSRLWFEVVIGFLAVYSVAIFAVLSAVSVFLPKRITK